MIMEKASRIEKFERIKTAFAPIVLGLGTLVLSAVLLYLSIDSDNVRSMTEAGTDNISYVLVNEDLGATFNGVDYNFGAEFVTVISQDTQNRWQTASRTVAEAGFRSGTFDVMIILPHNFSQSLLSLENFNPQQALITYEVRLGYNELANMAVREQVSAVLEDFSQRIVQMYFSSILGSLFDAQLNVDAMIGEEQGRHSVFVDDIRTPFYSLPNVFSRVVNDTLFLENETSIWRSQHIDFTELASEILTTANEEVTETVNDIGEFLELMQAMTDTNLTNAEFIVTQQAELDEEFYREQFSELNETMVEYLYTLEGEILYEFSVLATIFHESQEFIVETLTEQIVVGEKQGSDLIQEINALLMHR